MATRYLALLGAAPSTLRDALRCSANDLRLVHTWPTGALYCNVSEAALLLPDGTGAVIGTLFTRSDSLPVTPLNAANKLGAVARSGLPTLIDKYWGGYVAFHQPDAVISLSVLRDPSGAMPCYYIQTDWGWAIASDIDLLIETALIRPEVDDMALFKHLRAFDFRTEQTSLKGVHELLAGTRLILDGKTRKRDCLWTPWFFVAPKAPHDEADRLRETVRTCVEAWGRKYPRVLLGLSGGLDSSVVAASLAGHTDLLALTMFTDEGEGDERHYAHAVSDALNLDLLEGFHAFEDINLTRPTSVHLPRPLSGAFGQSENKLKFRLAQSRNIDALFSGIGGDNVFCYLRSISPLVDRLKSEGLGRGVFHTLDDVCELTGCSVKEAIAAAWDQFRNPITRYRWTATDDFLQRDMTSNPFTFDHPWLEAPPAALPGKIAHAAMLLRIQGTIDGFPRNQPAQINPLLSQPIMELCLSIPSWHWCRGGRNRAVTRDAFATDLPSTILNRRSKGGPTSFAYEVIDRNQGPLRDLLIGGVLDRAGLLDTKALSDALPVTQPVQAADYMRLSGLAEAEVWTRHWRDYKPSTSPKMEMAPPKNAGRGLSATL